MEHLTVVLMGGHTLVHMAGRMAHTHLTMAHMLVHMEDLTQGLMALHTGHTTAPTQARPVDPVHLSGTDPRT